MDLEFSCNDKIRLVEDLADHGMLDNNLMIWGGEFGRTNYCQGLYKPGADFGRDHHPRCFTSWMAGGGIRPGISWGKTDEYGYNIQPEAVQVNDFHATLLHLLGIDHERLTYKFQGRRYRLTDVHGHVVNDILAEIFLSALSRSVFAIFYEKTYCNDLRSKYVLHHFHKKVIDTEF